MESIIILFVLIFDVIIILPTAIVYNHYIIKPNAKLPLYRIRRPKFLFIFILFFTLNGVFRIVLSLLHNLDLMNPTTFAVFNRLTLYYGSMILMCIRVWLLYHDLESARKQQRNMLTKHLTTNEDILDNETKFKLPTLSMFNPSMKRTNSFRNIHNGKYAHIYGQYKPLLIMVLTIATIVATIDLIIYFYINHSSQVCHIIPVTIMMV